ncbi:transmembrane protein 272-like [Clavelina lepadiformis]|uniref:Uncharacterized protein n=1 Tax=Clavelina lepadiformis TaxID=159417 RepID=A0ABP0FYG9_CLALP
MTEAKQYGTMNDPESGPAPDYYPDAEHNEPATEPSLPTYTETQNEAPPPTYESIYGEIKAAQRNSSNRGHFLKSVCLILFNTIGFTILIAVLLAVPIAMIVVGALNLHRCPIERFIPIWLIVGGSVGAFMQLMSIIKRIKSKCEGTESEEEDGKAYSGCSGLLGCFNIAWFLAGNVWVYRIYHPNTNPADDDSWCDATTYYLAFWVITSVYIAILFMCCCSCCIAVLVGGKSSSDD